MSSRPADYVFDGAAETPELARLRAIERVCDPASRRRLAATGLGEGWSCLEVGPGAGSLLSWMADQVGPGGRVCGVDLSTKFLTGPHAPHVDILAGDIRTVPLPDRSFDLVHARYVLIHVADPEVAITRILRALKPGGWLVLEQPDFSASRAIAGSGADRASVARINQAIEAMYRSKDLDPAFGAHLAALLHSHGVGDLVVEPDATPSVGGSGMAVMMALSAEQLRDKYIATGLATEDDVARYVRFAHEPTTSAVYYATVAVSGRAR